MTAGEDNENTLAEDLSDAYDLLADDIDNDDVGAEATKPTDHTEDLDAAWDELELKEELGEDDNEENAVPEIDGFADFYDANKSGLEAQGLDRNYTAYVFGCAKELYGQWQKEHPEELARAQQAFEAGTDIDPGIRAVVAVENAMAGRQVAEYESEWRKFVDDHPEALDMRRKLGRHIELHPQGDRESIRGTLNRAWRAVGPNQSKDKSREAGWTKALSDAYAELESR